MLKRPKSSGVGSFTDNWDNNSGCSLNSARSIVNFCKFVYPDPRLIIPFGIKEVLFSL